MSKTRKPAGGLRRVWLLEADQILRADFTEKECTTLLLGEGAILWELPLAEQESRFEEEAALQDGLLRYTHRLELHLDPVEGAAIDPATLQTWFTRGVVALLETIRGEARLVGLSERLGREAPLRLQGFCATSGRLRRDLPTLHLKLACEDGWPAAIVQSENLITYENA